MGISNKWVLRHLGTASSRAGWSKDPSTKVGAVIIRKDGKSEAAMGYNGYPRGLADVKLDDRPYKYSRTIHAELNAIYNSRESLEDCAMFVTLAPCHECAKGIIQNGIKEVYHIQENFLLNDRWMYSHLQALLMFQEAGVVCSGVKSDGTCVDIPQQKRIIRERLDLDYNGSEDLSLLK